MHVDVTSKDEVDALFATAKDVYGSVDIAFNNAGISPPDDDSILDTELDAWRRVQEVNLTSVYLCCKAALTHMLEQGSGSIINTASFVAVMGAATSQISYSASKGGVLSMTRELGVQFAREGIRVNALCPGPVNTPLLQELFAADAERAARRLVHVPMGRFGSPTRDGHRGAVPGLRRLLVHHRHHVPRRRGHLRCLRDPALRSRDAPVSASRLYREQAAWGVWHQRADVLQAYADTVARPAASLCCSPPSPDDPDARRGAVVARLDGLVISGGADVDPGRYDAEPHPRTAGWRPERDGWELALLDAAERVGLPTLGVCRACR